MERLQMMLCLFLVSTWIKLSVSVPNVPYVFVVSRSETELTLGWHTDNSSYSYIVKGSHEDQYINSSGYLGGVMVTHRVSSLSPGTEYTFTVFTVFEGMRSSGYNFTTVTSLADVESVSVLNCTENEITMEWNKVNNINDYVLVILIDYKQNVISGSDNASVVRHTVSSLRPGCVHRFRLRTVVNREMSDGYLFYAPTAPQKVDGVTVQGRSHTSITLKFWDTKQVSGNRHFYILKYGEIEAYMGQHNDDRIYDYLPYRYGPHIEHFYDHYYEDTYTVTSLSPGTKYNFTLYSVLNGARSLGYKFTAETTPSKVTGLHCEYSWMGSVTLNWDGQMGQYDFSPTSLSGEERSRLVSIKCQTSTLGVIAIYVLLVLLTIVLLVCLGVFCKYRRFDLQRCVLGERVKEGNAADQPLDRIYVNTSTRNTSKNHNSSVESESKDTSNHYEAPNMIA